MPGGYDPISDSCRLRQRLATMARDVVVTLRSTRLYLRSGSRSHGCLVSLLEGGDWNMENPLKMVIFPLIMVDLSIVFCQRLPGRVSPEVREDCVVSSARRSGTGS